MQFLTLPCLLSGDSRGGAGDGMIILGTRRRRFHWNVIEKSKQNGEKLQDLKTDLQEVHESLSAF